MFVLSHKVTVSSANGDHDSRCRFERQHLTDGTGFPERCLRSHVLSNFPVPGVVIGNFPITHCFSGKPSGTPLLNCTPAKTEPNEHHHFVRTLIANRIRPTAIRPTEMTTDSLEKVFRLNPSMPTWYRKGF
jgi:hypothetical protein